MQKILHSLDVPLFGEHISWEARINIRQKKSKEYVTISHRDTRGSGKEVGDKMGDEGEGI